MGRTVEIKGLDALRKTVHEITDVVVEDINIIAREGLNDMNNQAIRNISSNGLVDTGFLRNSQQVTLVDGQYTLWNSAPYAPYHEFGTGGMVKIPAGWQEVAAQFKGKGIKIVNIPARPFMIPAFNQYHPIIVQDIEDAIKRAIK